jgi:hypothetical protein
MLCSFANLGVANLGKLGIGIVHYREFSISVTCSFCEFGVDHILWQVWDWHDLFINSSRSTNQQR